MYYEFYCSYCDVTYYSDNLEDVVCPICKKRSKVVKVDAEIWDK